MTRPTFGTIADLDLWIARAAEAGDDEPTIGSIPMRDRLAADASALAELAARPRVSPRTAYPSRITH